MTQIMTEPSCLLPFLALKDLGIQVPRRPSFTTSKYIEAVQDYPLFPANSKKTFALLSTPESTNDNP